MQQNPGTIAAGDRFGGLHGLHKYNEMTSNVRIELHTLDPDMRCITFSQSVDPGREREVPWPTSGYLTGLTFLQSWYMFTWM